MYLLYSIHSNAEHTNIATVTVKPCSKSSEQSGANDDEGDSAQQRKMQLTSSVASRNQ